MYSTINGLPDEYSSLDVLKRTLKTLLEWFIDFEEQDIDALDKRGTSALFHAADYTSPLCVETLIAAGADPMISSVVRPWIALETIMGITVREQLDVNTQLELLVNPCEHVLVQLYLLHVLPTSSRPAGAPLSPAQQAVPSGLPIAEHLQEQQTTEVHNKFRTIAALSNSPGTEGAVRSLSSLPEDMQERANKYGIKGLIPNTSRLSCKVVKGLDEEFYVETWGIYSMGRYEIRVHVGVIDELPEREVFNKLQEHSHSRYPIIRHRSTTLEPYFFRWHVLERTTKEDGSSFSGEDERLSDYLQAFALALQSVDLEA
jgi:hypothetical protein